LVAGLTVSIVFKAQAEAQAAALLAANGTIQARQQDILKLSAFRTLEGLEERTGDLWPARPALVDAYREWLGEAEKLLAALPESRAAVARIEQRAVPQPAEERERERTGDPRTRELDEKRALALWLARMVGRAPWPTVEETEAELARETLPADS